MMITSSFNRGFGNEPSPNNFLHPGMSMNSVMRRVEPHLLGTSQPVYNFTSPTAASCATVPDAKVDFYASTSCVRHTNIKTVNRPDLYSYNPASQIPEPGLSNIHHANQMEHCPRYQDSNFDMKNGPGNMWQGNYHQQECFPYDSTCHPHYPFNPRFGGVDFDESVRRKNATRESTTTLKTWLRDHKKNPYPTKGEKVMLAIVTKMTLTQVSTWFANARRRLKKENKMTWVPKNRSNDSNNHSNQKKKNDNDDDDDDDDNLSQDSQDSGLKSDNELLEDLGHGEDSCETGKKGVERLSTKANLSSVPALIPKEMLQSNQVVPTSMLLMQSKAETQTCFASPIPNGSTPGSSYLNGNQTQCFNRSSTNKSSKDINVTSSRSALPACNDVASMVARKNSGVPSAAIPSCGEETLFEQDSNSYVTSIRSANQIVLSDSQTFSNVLCSQMNYVGENINPTMSLTSPNKNFNSSPERMISNNFLPDTNKIPESELPNSAFENQENVFSEPNEILEISNSSCDQYLPYPEYKFCNQNDSDLGQTKLTAFFQEKGCPIQPQTMFSTIPNSQTLQYQQYC